MGLYCKLTFAAVMVAVLSSPSFGDDFTVDSALGMLTLRDTNFTTNSEFANTLPLPQVGPMSLTGTGAAASLTYNYSNAGLSLQNLVYTLEPGAFAEAYTQFIVTPLVNISYEFNGALEPSGGFGTPTIFGQVADITSGFPGTNLFSQQVQSSGTANQAVALTDNMGTLLSGHQYLITFDIAQDTNLSNNSTIGAVGGEAIQFTALSQSVPEPSSFMLTGIGAASLLITVRRRRD